MAKLPMNAKLLGHVFEPIEVSWDHKDTILYALGVGAKPEGQLDFVFEGKGPKVLPSFAVIPGGCGLAAAIENVDLRLEMLLHGEQSFTLSRPIPPRAKGRVYSKIIEVWDKGKAAIVGVESTLEDSDGVLLTTYASLFVRGAGGFGGERGPAGEARNTPLERAPDAVVSETPLLEQGAIYRLSGDWNPIHIDPEFARLGGFDAPFMHGLCTYGFVCRAALKTLCSDDPAKFTSMTGRFADRVLYGDTIITKIWKTAPGEAILHAETQKGNIILSQGAVTYIP
ncbi:MAG: 3-alpha,7-alpha,12-alpha-trihydroxy-5-beta-cholest-24-enoyl-CoA hydratase [Alphaproteobacteria bacterium]|nr:3-alpha,7-alpha,12-alpha-trihydroxy-5-beta-cholest-24-enoyl-CoA hydratase [Alphaproteobacteria bacterium]